MVGKRAFIAKVLSNGGARLVCAVPVQFEKLPGLTVSVDKVLYDPSRPAPPDRPHPFIYYLSIHNESEEPVNIFGRKWIVRDTEGDTLVVEGDGVVGQFPRIEPGEAFSYNSYHVIKADSTATGSFFGRTDGGKPVCARIPNFEMTTPPLLA
jgi:ApaG protein